MIADTLALAAAARRRRGGRSCSGAAPPACPRRSCRRGRGSGRICERGSVWLHNSLRAAAALGLAVLLIQVVRIDHSFWVVFGTSRSSARAR